MPVMRARLRLVIPAIVNCLCFVPRRLLQACDLSHVAGDLRLRLPLLKDVQDFSKKSANQGLTSAISSPPFRSADPAWFGIA